MPDTNIVTTFLYSFESFITLGYIAVSLNSKTKKLSLVEIRKSE